MDRSVLVVYSCYNPPSSLLDSIQSVYSKVININHFRIAIVCVDNDSNILTTYDIIKSKFPDVEIIFNKNKNYEWGAYKYAHDNFPYYDFYFCLQDTIIFEKPFDIDLIEDNSPYTIFHSGGFKLMGRGFSSQDLLNHKMFKQNINFDDMVNEDFILCQHNTLLITRSDLSKLFKFLINPPTNKIETEMYERIFGAYFDKTKHKRRVLNPYIKKIDREDRIFITKK
tara:strand:+ start:629 stop:1306 length:678 start_codon:yes stop_codon:yes gene_type:complete